LFEENGRGLTYYKPHGLNEPTKCVLRNIPADHKRHASQTMMICSNWNSKQRI
jgi:hypothetical protein